MSPSNNRISGEPAGIKIYRVANRLLKKLGIRPNTGTQSEPGEISPEAIIEAQQHIETLCGECEVTLSDLLAELVAAWVDMRDMAQSEKRQEVSQKIFLLAHEIKDVGGLCKYDLAAYFAESLRDFIERTTLSLEAQRVIIQAHVDALQVIVKQGLKDEASPAAEELKKMVKIAVEKYG